MSHIKNMSYVMTGIFVILVSMFALYLSYPLSSFTEVGLGPGFVPRMLAWVQLVLGSILFLSGFLTAGEPLETWHLRPLMVLAAIAFFGLTIERFGLAIALTGLVLIACAAHRGTKVHEAVALALGSVAFSALVFVKALGLSIPLWPSNLWGG